MTTEFKDVELGEMKRSDAPIRSEHKHEPKIQSNDKWNFGCCQLDRKCVQYFAQLGLLTLCIGTSLYQVSTNSENREFWIGLLSSCIGVIVPSPKLKK
jgi:hypothetical protein